MIRLLVVIATAVTLGACGTTRNANQMSESVTGLTRPMDSLDTVSTEGRRLMAVYLQNGERTRSNRVYLNLGILAANTFVTTASGLEAHADTIFAGSMVGQALHGLDPILNAGSTAVWSRAYGRTACILGFVDLANSPRAIEYVGVLRGDSGAADGPATLLEYERLIAFAQSELISTYVDYLTGRTPDLLANERAPETGLPPALRPPPSMTARADRSAEASRGLAALVEASRAGITQCRPPAPPS